MGMTLLHLIDANASQFDHGNRQAGVGVDIGRIGNLLDLVDVRVLYYA